MHLPSIRQNLIKMERTERIARLISARMLGQELTEEEKRELDDWLGEEQANKDLLEEVRSLRGVRQFVQLEQEGYGEQMAAAFAERCRGGKRRSLSRGVLLRWLCWWWDFGCGRERKGGLCRRWLR